MCGGQSRGEGEARYYQNLDIFSRFTRQNSLKDGVCAGQEREGLKFQPKQMIEAAYS